MTTALGLARPVVLASLVLAQVVGAAGTAARALEVPFLSGRVNDYADLIDAEAEDRIGRALADLETRRGHQIAVLTIESLEGEAIEDFSHRVAETWALGGERRDDGILLLVARRDRKMRIEVGYGLEADLTDAESGRILRRALAPRFQKGDFSGGIEAGIDAIVAALEGAEGMPAEAAPLDPEGGRSGPLRILMILGMGVILVSGLFSVEGLFADGARGWILYVLLMPFWYALVAWLAGPRVGAICLAAWIVVYPLLRLVLRRPAGRRWLASQRGRVGDATGGAWHHGGWGGGASSGGFSGGGGSFGGGGASGSW